MLCFINYIDSQMHKAEMVYGALIRSNLLKSGCGINEGSKKSGDFVANECQYNRCSYDYIRYLHLNSMRTRNVG